MEITNQPLEWDSEDVQAFSHFLGTRTGSRLLPKVAEMVPALLHKGDVNEILIRSGVVLGAQEMMRNILALAVPEVAPVPENPIYPSLDDDKSWNDGKKIQ